MKVLFKVWFFSLSALILAFSSIPQQANIPFNFSIYSTNLSFAESGQYLNIAKIWVETTSGTPEYVHLSLSNVPVGILYDFKPHYGIPPFTSTLGLDLTNTNLTGTYTFSIGARRGGTSRVDKWLPLTLTITAPRSGYSIVILAPFIYVEDQTGTNKIVIASAEIDKPGWVLLHTANKINNPDIDSTVGIIYIWAGSYRNLD